ncbi:MAG: hypothetical protein WBO54_09460, partial [Thermoanaerobaculia bacterium]
PPLHSGGPPPRLVFSNHRLCHPTALAPRSTRRPLGAPRRIPWTTAGLLCAQSLRTTRMDLIEKIVIR